MKTLQEKYNAVLEGKYPKSQFVRSAQIEVPTFISKYSGFADSVQILINKGLISEAKDEAPEYDKPAPGYNLYDLDRGVDYELEKLGIDTGTEVPDEKTHLKAKAKAEKNLEKNPNYYLHILAGDNTPYPDPSQDSHDREVEVDQKKLFKGTVDPTGGKAEGNTDTFNAMKKANLNEATKKKLAKLLKEGAVEDLAKKLGIPIDKLQASIDKIKKAETVATAAAAKAAKPTYSENDNKKLNEEMAPTGIGISGDQLKDLNKLGAIAGVEVTVRDKDGSNIRKVDYTLTNTSYEKNPDDIDFPDPQEGEIKEAVKKVIKYVLNENHQSLDLEVARRIEGLLNINKKSDFLKAGYRLIEDLVEDDPFDRNDVISHLANELNLYTPIRDLFKEGALNESRGDLDIIIRIIDDRADESGFEPREEAAEVIAAIADHYKLNLKMIQNYLDSDDPVNPVAEGENINEALNAPLEKIGREIYNKFEKAGAFKIKAVTSNPGSLDKYMNPVRKDSSLVAIVGDNTQLYVYTHLDNLQLVQDIIKDLDIKNSIKDAGDDGVYFKSKKPGAIASNGLVVVSLGSGDKVVGENKKYKYTKRQK